MSSLGWQINSQLNDVRPRARISYNQQLGENIWKAQSGPSRTLAADQDSNWMDVTVGTDMLLNPHMAAYVALSQAENSTNNNGYMCTMGVSAKF